MKINVKGKDIQICTRCTYDENVQGISFDDDGVCNFCHIMDQFADEYKTGQPEGEAELKRIIEEIKREGKGKKYDCVVGVSGGTDSSYLLVKCIEWGLRPLAVNYDNTWGTATAEDNIKAVIGKLGVDLYTYRIDDKEADDIFKSFFEAGVQEVDGSTDLACTEVMYRAANKYGIRYVMEGHSYKTEGISPISNNYFDGKYIQDIHRKFGHVPMRTYPLLTFWRFMYWTFVKQIKRIRPFWYIDYTKAEAREYLQTHLGWKYYGGHHLENRMAALYHSWWNYERYHVDTRNVALAAAVRSGVMERNKAINEYYYNEPAMEDGLLEYFKNRMGYDDKDLERLINAPKKTYKDFKTYKKYFRLLAPLFKLGVKSNLVVASFYVKYCTME